MPVSPSYTTALTLGSDVDQEDFLAWMEAVETLANDNETNVAALLSDVSSLQTTAAANASAIAALQAADVVHAADIATLQSTVAGLSPLPDQVSGAEITAGTETALRSYSPEDIVALIDAHAAGGGGGGGTPPNVITYGSGTGTWTKPSGLAFLEIWLVGGGGSGNGTVAVTAGNASSGGGGGGGGGYYGFIPAASLGATENWEVGAGGVAPGGLGSNAGGQTTFGGLTLTEIRVSGGAGGVGFGAASSANQATGATDGGTVTQFAGVGVEFAIPGNAGQTGLRFGGGEAMGGSGGNSWLGGGAKGERAANSQTNGTSAVGRGGGGSGAAAANGSFSAKNGGNGFNGLILLKEHFA